MKNLKTLFNDRLHVYFSAVKGEYQFKSYLPKKEAIKIIENVFYEQAPVCFIFSYQQDENIKDFQYIDERNFKTRVQIEKEQKEYLKSLKTEKDDNNE